MSAVLLLGWICAVVGVIAARIQTHARWWREAEADEAWIAELQAMNAQAGRRRA